MSMIIDNEYYVYCRGQVFKGTLKTLNHVETSEGSVCTSYIFETSTGSEIMVKPSEAIIDPSKSAMLDFLNTELG